MSVIFSLITKMASSVTNTATVGTGAIRFAPTALASARHNESNIRTPRIGHPQITSGPYYRDATEATGTPARLSGHASPPLPACPARGPASVSPNPVGTRRGARANFTPLIVDLPHLVNQTNRLGTNALIHAFHFMGRLLGIADSWLKLYESANDAIRDYTNRITEAGVDPDM